jgi:rod shape-determining protein MreD
MSLLFSTGMQSDSKVEVHKFYGGTILAAAILALVLQGFLHRFGQWSQLIELPLLVTIYFGVSRRNPVSGLLLGAAIGILQDGLSHDNPIGLYGIAKTLVGYFASSVGAKIDTEHPIARFGLVFILFHFHQAVLAVTQRALLSRPAPIFNLHLLLESIANATFAVLLFAVLDRLRKPH